MTAFQAVDGSSILPTRTKKQRLLGAGKQVNLFTCGGESNGGAYFAQQSETRAGDQPEPSGWRGERRGRYLPTRTHTYFLVVR